MSAQPSSSSTLQKTKVFVFDQHASNISRSLQTFFDDHVLVDIALTTKTDSVTVYAHRAVLSASSGHFRAVLCSTLKKSRADVIELEIDGATLELVIDFMYSGTIELRCDNVERILVAANILKMSTLKAECADFIGDSSDLTNRLSIAMSAQPSSSSTLQKTKVFVYDQHASNISRNLQTFFDDQVLVDIALTTKTNSVTVHAHRAVLSASSGHFRAVLCSTLKKARADVIDLEIDGATLELVIDFMYSGTIELRRDNVERILIAADILKMNTLKAACSDFIEDRIDLTNNLSVASMAKSQQSAKLHESTLTFALEHFEEMRQREDFLQLTEDNLIEIISSDDLCVDSEKSVFHSLVSWVEYDKRNREKCITNLLTHVRFSFLKSEFIIENQHFICKTVESSEVIFSWLESSMSGTKLTKQHSERKKANGTQIETLGFLSRENLYKLIFMTLHPISNTWSNEDFPPPPESIASYRATAIDKKLIIAGGWLNGAATNTVLQLDLQTKEWTNLPPMRNARQLPAIAELNGDLYIVGGWSDTNWSCSVEKYDFRTREWQEMAPTNLKYDLVEVTVLDGLLYAVGQCDFPIECYNPANNKWIQIPHKIEKSKCFGIAGVDGYLYAVGGLYNRQESTTVECYHPATETWTVISPGLGIALLHLKCISWNNRLVACKGFDTFGNAHNLVEEYNPETNEWKTLAPFLECDLECTAGSLFTFIK